MIDSHRALCMDEQTGARHAGFDDVRAFVGRLLAAVEEFMSRG
jgi:hypothetical protein